MHWFKIVLLVALGIRVLVNLAVCASIVKPQCSPTAAIVESILLIIGILYWL